MPISRLLPFVLLLYSVVLAATASSQTLTPSQAVARGIAYFQKECVRQQSLMPELLTAISYKDLSRAINAYVAARPPYEQIETLAGAFEQQDTDIDARPYVFHTGEDDPEFRGFHVIERALYRDQRLADHLYDVAVTLNNSVNSLCVALSEMDRFNVFQTFSGVIALSFEVPAKKVASEEETWSDLSLMIFRNNYRGIWSQTSPFFRTGLVSKATIAKARGAYAAIQKVFRIIDPMHPFWTNAGDARPYSSLSTRERWMLVAPAYRLAVAMEHVRDEVFAGIPGSPPDGDNEEEEDDDTDPDVYADAKTEGLRRFLTQCKIQQQSVLQLDRVIKSGQLHASRMQYTRARPPYEQIEVLAADFPELDAYIDQRPYATERGELDVEWRGFHQVERALFRDNDLKAARKAMGPLIEAVDKLCDVLADGVEGDGTFTAERHFDGMITLAYEVPAKKISSEEETWSDLSVLIFRENLKGIWSTYEPFAAYVPPDIAKEVKDAYNMVKDLIRYTVDKNNNFENGTNFVKYSDVPVWFRKEISDKYYDLARALVKAKAALF